MSSPNSNSSSTASPAQDPQTLNTLLQLTINRVGALQRVLEEKVAGTRDTTRSAAVDAKSTEESEDDEAIPLAERIQKTIEIVDEMITSLLERGGAKKEEQKEEQKKE